MSDQPLGPGWWQASDGKFYPPSGPGQQPAVYQKPPMPAAHSVVTGCLVGFLILAGVLVTLTLVGLAIGPQK